MEYVIGASLCLGGIGAGITVVILSIRWAFQDWQD